MFRVSVVLIISISYCFVIVTSQKNSVPFQTDEEEVYFWKKELYPNPLEKPPFCNRIKSSPICDPDKILTKSQANKLEEIIKQIGNDSTCVCSYCPPNKRGLSIGVAIMKNMFQQFNSDMSSSARDFAEFLRRRWNLGICRNDVIILLSANDHQFTIVEGPTVQKVFPKHLTQETLLKTKTYFTDGKYYETRLQFVSMVENQDITITEHASGGHTNILVIVALTFGFLVIVTLLLLALWFARKRFVERIEKEEETFDKRESQGYWTRPDETNGQTPTIPRMTENPIHENSSDEEISFDQDSLLPDDGSMSPAQTSTNENWQKRTNVKLRY